MLLQSKNKIERKDDTQNLDNVQKHEQGHKIGRKPLPTTPDLHTNCHFKNNNLKVDHHTWGKWLIHDPKRRK